MSPEQAAGEREIDGRSDLYSLGVVGYQMLTGVPPFHANSTPALLVKHLSEAPVPVSDRAPDTPDDLARAIMLLLEKDPANRFPSAAAFEKALEERAIPADLAALPMRRPAVGGYATAASAGNAAALPMSAYGAPPTAVSEAEMARWEAPPVKKFRKSVAPFLFVNAVILLFAIFNGPNFLFVTAVWSVVMAYQYAKLWADGYDWRDVFKHSRDRMMFDVAAETIDDARALFDPEKRDAVRARERARRARLAQLEGATGGMPRRTQSPLAPGLPAGMPAGQPGGLSAARPAALPAGQPMPRTPHPAGIAQNGAALGAVAPEYLDAVRRADAEREEIARQLASLDRADRHRLGDVMRTANQLSTEVQSLAIALTKLEQERAPGAAEAVEQEIVRLEAQANPLEERASEDRVRRLAQLKRQRRALIDLDKRTQRDAVRLDTCVLALQDLRLNLSRLRSGQMAPQQVTQLAERAMSLASDMDGLVLAEEMARSGGRETDRGSRV
jgi:serine/threonine-protein kinase